MDHHEEAQTVGPDTELTFAISSIFCVNYVDLGIVKRGLACLMRC